MEKVFVCNKISCCAGFYDDQGALFDGRHQSEPAVGVVFVIGAVFNCATIDIATAILLTG